MSTSTHRPVTKTASWAVGDVLYHFPILDSTNAYALKLLSQIRPKPGTIISAAYQTAGRGQHERSWHSAPGLNLCLSVVLYSSIPPQQQFRISMAISLAVRDSVQQLIPNISVTIRWPNDIYVENRKIAGILIQNSIQGNQITSCVAGIGLNVNESCFPDALPNPTSLRLETGETYDLPVTRDILSYNLTQRHHQLNTDISNLIQDYHDALYRRHQKTRIAIVAEDASREGVISHVDSAGRLVIRWEDGEAGAYQFREIEYR